MGIICIVPLIDFKSRRVLIETVIDVCQKITKTDVSLLAVLAITDQGAIPVCDTWGCHRANLLKGFPINTPPSFPSGSTSLPVCSLASQHCSSLK